MRTPAGKECAHYYEDFNRGRQVQECRLVKENPASRGWRAQDCARCPVPDIMRANANPHMKLTLTIRGALLGFVRRMEVDAWCLKHNIPITNPYVGCPLAGEETEALRLFRDALEETDSND